MKRQWIKLYLEIMDDAKMGRLSDHLWRRTMELFLLAGENDKDGLLPEVDDMAWRLRTSPDDLTRDLQSLQGVVVEPTQVGWFVTNFKDRQYSESYERMKRYRNAKSNGDGNGDVAEKESSSPSSSPSLSYSSSEGEGAGEGTWIPTTPKEAATHPDIMVYQQVTGRFPGDRDYARIIDTVQYLREKHGEAVIDFLKPYWTAWSTRKVKSTGKAYNPASLVWLGEWAMTGDIPSANGHEPKSGELNSVDEVINQVVHNANNR